MRPFKKSISIFLSILLIFGLFVGCADSTFKVTFDANGGVLEGSATISKKSGQTIEESELPKAAKDGYDFLGWFLNSDASGDAVTFPYKVTKDITLYAGWKEKTQTPDKQEFTVTFDANGGELQGDSKITKESGQTITEDELPTAVREGYVFKGWFDNAEASGEAVAFPYTVTKNATLYAGWAQEAQKVKYLFEAEVYGVVSGSPNYGDKFIDPAENASGGAVLGYLGVAGNAVTITVTAEEAGKADLEFVFSSSNIDLDMSTWTMTVIDQTISPSTIKLELNGNEIAYEETVIPGSNQPNGFNLVFGSLWIKDVDLVKGENTIKLTALTSAFPNFDCLNVYSTVKLAVDNTEPQDSVYQGAVSFKLVVGAYPGGPAVDKAILCFEDQVSADELDADTFVVSHVSTGFFGTQTVKMKGVDVYLSDAEGNQVQGAKSHYVTVKYNSQYSNYSFASNNAAFVYNFTTQTNSWLDKSTLKLTVNTGKNFVVNGVKYTQLTEAKVTFDEIVVPALKDWKVDGTHTYQDETYGEITLTYAAYEPEALKNGQEKNPLIIWLHGAGEGGTDPTIAVLGNEVTYLAKDEIQSYFKSGSEVGAYILAVQTPTMWMDDGTGQYGDGSVSKYTNALWDTIKAYVESNGDIDENRIYVGGCSNGGFMTVNMLITDTENYFAAAFPICQAYNVSKIDSETMARLAQKAIWFTHAANDKTVNVDSSTNKLYVDLINAGAENVFYSYFADVTYEGVSYDGHWSWIYTLRNECKYIQPTKGVDGELTIEDLDPASTLTHEEFETLWAWLAAQHK